MSALLAALDALSAALLLAMLGIAIANLVCAPRLERAGQPSELPLVSVLVPARNEAGNLRANLPHLLASAYPRLEIVVLDDRSEDGTAAVAGAFARRNPGRLRVIRGAPLPDGWLGKSWACHQLAEAARGQVLLFCDADVAAGPRAVTRTVALLQRAGAVTALPRHRFGTRAEAAVVPLVAQVPVAATLPLALVPRLRATSVSMANGQWLAFTRRAYHRAGGHASVRGEVLEDVRLGRAVKRTGSKLMVALATEDLSVRMYHGWPEVRGGFEKNLYALLGGRPAAFAAGVAIFLLVAVYPWIAALRGTPLALAALAMLAGVRAAAAALFRHGWRPVLLHPLGAVLALGIAETSFRTRGRVEWRGRTVAVGAPRRSIRLAPPGGGREIRSNGRLRAGMMDAEEVVVLVDEHDREVGTAPKLQAHERGLLHRAFSVFVLNARGEVLLQRRADGKYHSGGLWTNTACGHPRPGEPVAAAARRRLREEMGIDCALAPAGSFVYRADVGPLVEHEYDHLFRGFHDASPHPDSAEVSEWRWIDPAAALADAEAHPGRYTPWFARALAELARRDQVQSPAA